MPLTDMETEELEEERIEEPEPEPEEEEPEPQLEAEEEPEPEPEPEDKAEYGKKVQKRIDQLTARSKYAEEQLELEQARREELLERIHRLEQDHQEARAATETSSIQGKMKQLKAQRNAAYDEGDLEAMDRIDEELFDLRFQLKTAKREPSRQEPQPQRQAQQPRQPVIQAEVDWEKRNPWFTNGSDSDRDFAAGLYVRMLEEGHDRYSDDFYHELDRRIEAAAPGLRPKRQAPARSRSSAVAGASRAPGTRARNPKVATKEDKATMIRYGFGDPDNPKDVENYLRYSKGDMV